MKRILDIQRSDNPAGKWVFPVNAGAKMHHLAGVKVRHLAQW
jgi:hypothetical protein